MKLNSEMYPLEYRDRFEKSTKLELVLYMKAYLVKCQYSTTFH